MNRTRPPRPPAAIDRKGRQETRQQILLLYRNTERLQLAAYSRADALTFRSQEPGRDPERPGHRKRTRPTLPPILTTTGTPEDGLQYPDFSYHIRNRNFLPDSNKMEGGEYGTK